MATASPTTRRLGDLLLEKGFLSEDKLRVALEAQQSNRSRLLGEILVDEGYCSEEQILECLAAEFGVPYAKLDARLFDPAVVDVLPREYIEQNLVLPLFVVRKTLAIAVPESSNAVLVLVSVATIALHWLACR